MQIIKTLTYLLPQNIASAHCDIPCGIYDPHTAQMAAHTVMRMTQLIHDTQISSENPSFEERKSTIHSISRLTKIKEEHAELVKHEVRVLWGDYFKPEHLEKFPELNNLVWETLKLASKAKQNIDPEVAQKLLENVQKFAEIFYQTKGLEPVSIPAGYPTGGEIVFHK